jgi:hypothetical protein
VEGGSTPSAAKAAQRGRSWWSASEFAIENWLWIRQHPLGFLTQQGAPDHDRFEPWQLREVAEQDALAALAQSRPGCAPRSRTWSWQARRRRRGLVRGAPRSWLSSCCWWREKGRWGYLAGSQPGSTRPQGQSAGGARAGRGPGGSSAPPAGCWSLHGVGLPVACRRAADQLADGRPGGSPLHGLLDWEVAEIVALLQQWARSTAPTARSPPRLLPGTGPGVTGQRAPRAGA